MIRIAFSLVGLIKLSNEVKNFLRYLNSKVEFMIFFFVGVTNVVSLRKPYILTTQKEMENCLVERFYVLKSRDKLKSKVSSFLYQGEL